jgi:hypothetical protein
MDIQPSGFAVTLLPESTEHISDAYMAGGSEMDTGLYFFMA